MPEKEITLYEIYETVNEIKSKVCVIESTLNGRGGVFERVEKLEVSDKAQNESIMKAIGMVTILAIIIPIAVKLIFG